MNKEQYFNQHRLLELQRQELERKWRLHHEEQRMIFSDPISIGVNAAFSTYVNDYSNDYFE